MTGVKTKKLKIFFLIICIIQLFYIFYFRSDFKYEVIKNPFNKNSGIFYALDPAVIESNDILKKHKAIDFNLSESLKPEANSNKNTYFYQRSIEFNYPVRINNNSKFVFLHIDEDVLVNCKVLDIGKHLQLNQC